MNEFTFSTLPYERPDFDALKEKAQELTAKVGEAVDYQQIRACMMELDQLSQELSTNFSIVHIRHTLDTRDEFYEKENEYINQMYPTVMPYLIALNQAFMDSPFRADFEAEFGKQIFVQMELQQ